MGLLLAVYLWSAFTAPGQERAIKQSTNKLLCHYLQYDYLRISDEDIKLLPSVIQRHYERVVEVVNEYQRDPTARRQAETWLQEGGGDWEALDIEGKKKQDCLGAAIAAGYLSRHPKRRVFVALADLKEGPLRRQQASLDRLVKQLKQTRFSHPHYGWGLRPSERRWHTILTSFWIPGHLFSLLWALLALWFVGQLLERQTGPLWLAFFLIGGLVSNLALMFLASKQNFLLLGPSGALAGCFGAWMLLGGLGQFELHYNVPGTKYKGSVSLPAIALGVTWLIFGFLDVLVVSQYPSAVFLVHIVCFGLCAGLAFVLQEQGVFQDTDEDAPIQKARPETTRHLTTPRMRPKARPDIDEKALAEKAKEAYEKGDYRKAVGLYREAITPGKTPLWIFEGLLTACEKSELSARPEEYINAIRVAADEGHTDKVKSLYHQFVLVHGPTPISARDRLLLTTTLKRCKLFQEASIQADRILDKGSSNPFYMKALLLKAESLLEMGKQTEKALQLFQEGEELLAHFPEYQEAITHGKARAEKQLDAMFGSGGLAFGEAGDDDDDLGGELVSPSFDEYMKNKKSEPVDIDDKMLRDLELYEALAEKAQSKQADSSASWAELPSLVLKREQKKDAADDGPTSMFAPSAAKPAAKSMFAPQDDDFITPFEEASQNEVSLTLAAPEEASISKPTPPPSDNEDAFGASLSADLDLEAEFDLGDDEGGFPDVLTAPKKITRPTPEVTREHRQATTVDPSALIEDFAPPTAEDDWNDWEVDLPEETPEEPTPSHESGGAHPWEQSAPGELDLSPPSHISKQPISTPQVLELTEVLEVEDSKDSEDSWDDDDWVDLDNIKKK
tara:strand:- start:3836 stop:6373 length:2538 start_codon:yes stop_codon:yes gene_type:complete